MKIGIGEADITPSFPCPLAGFGLARTQPHVGVHDSISVRCALFEEGGEQIALVSCEVIGLKAAVVNQIRDAMPPDLGLSPGRIIITCTHTHGAPVIDGDFLPVLIAGVVKAVSNACQDLRERSLLFGIASHEEWTGFNRRNLETGFLPVDREIPFLTIAEADGKLRAVLFHYACHPSILGPDNLLVTADWPGFTRQAIQAKLGDDVSVIYLKGTEGDINSGYSAGISSLGIKIPTRTYETAERVGSIIARSLLSALAGASPMESPTIRHATRPIELCFRPAANLGHARETLAWWEAEVARIEKQSRPAQHVLNARVEQAYAKFYVSALEQNAKEGRTSRTCEQTAFTIGDAGFLCFPGEFFVESGLQTKREARSKVTFPLGIANDYLGYFPTQAAFPEGGYEVACARFLESTADDWTRSGVELLNELV